MCMNGQSAHEKNAQHHYSPGKCKFKLQWHTIKYPLERLKVKTMTMPNADEHMEQLELSDIPGRGKNDRTILEKKSFLKTEHIPTLWPSNFILSYLPKRKKSIFPWGFAQCS